MPVYNTKEEYLREAIESILTQTYPNFELIIINDGSSNNSEEVILSYTDERIKYHKQVNKGASAARNTGINIAKGEYIAIMDSDDISYSKRFEKQIDFLDKNTDVSLVGSWVKCNNRVIKTPETIKIIDLLADCCIMHPSIMFRKSDFDKYNLLYDEDLRCAEDYDLYAKALRHLNLSNLQEVLVDYRVYDKNTSSCYRDERVINSFKVQDKLLDYLTNDKNLKTKILNIAYTKKCTVNNFCEKLFSIKNLYKNYAKYKLITILGLAINFKIKGYSL